MSDDLQHLRETLRSHGPLPEKDVMAVNAEVALEAEGGNITRAAKRIGLTRYTFRVRLEWIRRLLSKH